MGPVRIKYWGLMWLTRRTYVVLQSIAFFFCLALMVVGYLAGLTLSLSATGKETVVVMVLPLLFWVGLAALLAESIETYMMLRKFARAEAEQQATLAALDAGGSAPPAPHSTGVQLPTDERSNTNIQP